MNAEQPKGRRRGGEGGRGRQDDEQRMTGGRLSLIAYLILSLPLFQPLFIYHNR